MIETSVKDEHKPQPIAERLDKPEHIFIPFLKYICFSLLFSTTFISSVDTVLSLQNLIGISLTFPFLPYYVR